MSSHIDSKDIKEAFRKLQSSIYYENTNLSLRSQLANFMVDGDNSIDEKLNKIKKDITDGKGFDKELDEISLLYYPKKISTPIEDKFPANFISNNFITKNFKIERCSLFCKMSVELHLIAVLWIMKYGYLLDNGLNERCMGNRLILDEQKDKIVSGKFLFKQYIKQYKKWWSDAINKAQQLFEEKSDVTIVNFDLKDYYHSVQLDFDLVEKEIGSDIKESNLHKLFKKIHQKYYDLIKLKNDPMFKLVENKYPLPIGLLSSAILGNWYLKEFDKSIEESLNPAFYARYVDDIIIVLKDRMINFETLPKDEIKDYFVKESLDINDETIDKKELSNIIHLLISKYFDELFMPYLDGKIRNCEDKEVKTINYKLKKYENLTLQKEKIFVYQFNNKLSPSIINKFIDDQKARSSEFRFLSDEEDDSFDEFDSNTFESNFDNIDGNKAKFKEIEDNKFKLSVFFAKLIKKRILKGKGYKNEEIIKIDKFFQGYYCLKHYYFWEKIFTLYLVYDNKELFRDFYLRIDSLISNLELSSEIKSCHDDLADSLRNHMENSMRMALGLNPAFINKKKTRISIDSPSLFRQSGLLRRQYMFYPLSQLTIKSKSKGDLESLINPKLDPKNRINIDTKHVPFDVKFYEVCYFKYNEVLTNATEDKCIDTDKFKTHELIYEDFTNNRILDAAFIDFIEINGKDYLLKEEHSADYNEYKNKYFECFEIENLVEKSIDISEVHLKSSEPHFSDINHKNHYIRLAIINKYVDFKDYEASLLDKRKLNNEDVETFFSILDLVEGLKECDLFVQPELSLPHVLIPEYMKYSATKQKGFISGVEFIPLSKIGFNFVLTCLPINIDGIRDAVPVYRLKNHYSPEEETFIRGKHMVVPKFQDESSKRKYRYDLFVWKDVYFSTYYCFELANIIHRTLMFSKVDAIFAPLWNKDIHYYNNIAESTSRDLHCYFVQANTSQYGESRVLRPTDHVRMDKTRIKGGTTKGNPVTLVVADLDIFGLRDFQSVDYSEQKERNKDNKAFKPTPPDFNKEYVQKRIDNKPFGKKI